MHQRSYKVIKIPRDFLSNAYQVHYYSGKVGVSDLIWIIVHSFFQRTRGLDVEKLASFSYTKSMANKNADTAF